MTEGMPVKQRDLERRRLLVEFLGKRAQQAKDHMDATHARFLQRFADGQWGSSGTNAICNTGEDVVYNEWAYWQGWKPFHEYATLERLELEFLLECMQQRVKHYYHTAIFHAPYRLPNDPMDAMVQQAQAKAEAQVVAELLDVLQIMRKPLSLAELAEALGKPMGGLLDKHAPGFITAGDTMPC